LASINPAFVLTETLRQRQLVIQLAKDNFLEIRQLLVFDNQNPFGIQVDEQQPVPINETVLFQASQMGCRKREMLLEREGILGDKVCR
jgi:hypothetical protein